MPLIDHHEAKQHDDGRVEVVEVQAAVALDEELGILETRVSTVQSGVIAVLIVIIVTMVRHLVLKDFHPQNSEDVVKDLQMETLYHTDTALFPPVFLVRFSHIGHQHAENGFQGRFIRRNDTSADLVTTTQMARV